MVTIFIWAFLFLMVCNIGIDTINNRYFYSMFGTYDNAKQIILFTVAESLLVLLIVQLGNAYG